jgi:hypothetical protein
MTIKTFQQGDQIKPVSSLEKIFRVKKVTDTGIIIERIDIEEKSRFFSGRPSMIITFEELDSTIKFIKA